MDASTCIAAAYFGGALPETGEPAAGDAGRYVRCGLSRRAATARPLLPSGIETVHLAVSAVTETASRRRIGDILLEHGFATEEQLAEAVAEQEQTGQPLGQILVQQGAITRLELASALAEQWSDQSVSIKLLPVPKPAPKPVPQHDDDQYAARLQDAVADLARRVQGTQASDADDARFTDLAERIEATVARTQRLEATLATFAESLEGVTGGVEEAFAGLQGGMASIALDLARIDATIAELRKRPLEPVAADPVLSERLEELGAAVTSLAERPVADDSISDRVDELAARLETMADEAAVQGLRGALGEIQAQVRALAGESPATVELERQAAFLTELRATVADLEARPVGSPELDARLEQIEAGLASRPEAGDDTASVEALAGRVAATAARQDELIASVEAIGARIDRIDAVAVDTERDGDTAARVDDLEARLAAGTVALVELRHEVEARPEPASAGALEQLSDVLDELGREVASLGRATPDDRLDGLAHRVDELAADGAAQAGLAARLEALERRLSSEIATSDELTRALDRHREELGAASPDPDGRVDQLIDDFGSLRAELARTRDDLAAAVPEPDGRVDQLIDDLASLRAALTAATTPEPGGRLDELADELASLRAELAAATPAPDERIDQLVNDLAFVQAELARTDDLAVGTSDPHLVSRLEELAGRVEGLAADQALPAPSSPGALETEQAVALLEERLCALEALSAHVDDLAVAVATASPGATVAPDDLRSEVEERIAELAQTLEDRLGAVSAAVPAASAAPVGVDDQLERMRMAIERVGLHLGEHDRALAELMRSRDVTQRVEELAARIDDLATAGPGGGAPSGSVRGSADAAELRALVRRVDDAEASAQADREKLMTRLERMAASLDWRLQRLEAGGAE